MRSCADGDQQAWERLYLECHPRLCQAIQYMLWRLGQQDQLTEEIAARVWFALVRDSGRLLGRFDAERDCRFGVFLVGLARNEILRYVRSERRRLRRERIGGRMRIVSDSDSKAEMEQLMREFASTLSDRERDFLQRFLLGDDRAGRAPDAPEMSDANVWQRRHRLRRKLKSFLDGD